MQNPPLSFYPEYNSYSTGDASNENDVFPPTINPNQMPIISQSTATTTTANLMQSKKRKSTIDTDASYSPPPLDNFGITTWIGVCRFLITMGTCAVALKLSFGCARCPVSVLAVIYSVGH